MFQHTGSQVHTEMKESKNKVFCFVAGENPCLNPLKVSVSSQAQRRTSLTPALGRKRPAAICELEHSLVYRVSSKNSQGCLVRNYLKYKTKQQTL